MCAFIVNPPIQDDADYYRDDEHVVGQILDGESKLVIGLRRSGKTSFLYRVRRAAQAKGVPCVYFSLADVGDPEIEGLGPAPGVVLLDEAEVWRTWTPQQIEKLMRALRRARVVVVTCAPEFILELEQEHDAVQRLIDGMSRHLIGPLSDEEARGLLTHAKRQEPRQLTDAQVAELLAEPDRLAILLQALGSERAGLVDLAVSLSGFGKRILTGLTPTARGILIDAAHDLPVPEGAETEILISTGALRQTPRGGVAIASPLLAELVSKASPRTIPPARFGETRDRIEREKWDRHARILHLSDLHFGRQAIDTPAVQARRLITALERYDRIPDFVAVTGDLSWSGHRSELRDAEAFLELLVQWLREKRKWDDLEARRRIIMVPGNHEASWLLSKGVHGAAGVTSEEDIEHWVRYSLGPFANFANRFYRRATFWDLDEPVLATTFTEPSISFLALSTAHYLTEVVRDARFGIHALERAGVLLSREDVSRARFRVGVWHHNLRPFQSQVGAIADVDLAIASFLKSKPSLDLALHGHVHQGEVETFLPRGSSGELLTYSAVGSFGVVAHHRPGDDVRGRVHNEFAIVDLYTSGAGRRMQTEFFALRMDPNAAWVWEPAAMSKPRPL